MRRSAWRYLLPILLRLLGSIFTDLPYLNYLLPFGRSIHWTAVYFHPFYYAELAAWILIAAVGVVRYRRQAWVDGLILVGALLQVVAVLLLDVGSASFLFWLLALGEVAVGAVRARKGWAPAATDPNLPYAGLEGKDAWRYKTPIPHKTTDLVAGNSYGSVFALTVLTS